MLGNLDLGIAIFYIVLILVVGILAGSGRFKKVKEISAEGYFLAGKTLRWPAIGLALFATNISTVHLVSLAQSGFDTGLLNGNFEWMAAFTLILLALFFCHFTSSRVLPPCPTFWNGAMIVPAEIGLRLSLYYRQLLFISLFRCWPEGLCCAHFLDLICI
jgi:SSS family solute:Na+ symporter